MEKEYTGEENDIKKSLLVSKLKLSEKLGQHFLIDQKAIRTLTESVLPGARVIEVGSGIGHVTKALIPKAGEVTGIEIDKRFQDILNEVQKKNPHIKFIIKDALQVDFKSLITPGEETQIIANLPFHITEPFLQKLIDLPISNALLLVGDNIAREIRETEKSLSFGKMSLLAQTFFEVRTVSEIPKSAFYPQPRTDTAIIELSPKNKNAINKNPADYIFASLFRKSGKFGLVANDMKQALIETKENLNNGVLSKKESHKRTRINIRQELRSFREDYNYNNKISSSRGNDSKNDDITNSQSHAMGIIKRMNIEKSILEKPFFRLDNQEIRQLAQSVRSFYNR